MAFSFTLYYFIILLILVITPIYLGLLNASDNRILRWKKTNKQFKISQSKSRKLVSLLKFVNAENDIPTIFEPESWSHGHRPFMKHTIFALALQVHNKTMFLPQHMLQFAATARSVGFDGDIVVGISHAVPQASADILNACKVVVYNISTLCNQTKDGGTICSLFNLSEEKFSVNMIRFYIYRWWAMKYHSHTVIMLCDLRDVIFQSNPFKYRTFEWLPPVSQLTLFKEAHPNAVIGRCGFNSQWIKSCYGKEALRGIGHNTVICSGVTFGTRDAILAYTYLMTKQLNPTVRRLSSNSSTELHNNACATTGMDQGFHNWLYYSGQLDRILDVRVFQQGEGPVNTVGAFFGVRRKIKWTLEKWGILEGKAPKANILNWNGDISPVVHQLDRFIANVTGELNVMNGLSYRT